MRILYEAPELFILKWLRLSVACIFPLPLAIFSHDVSVLENLSMEELEKLSPSKSISSTLLNVRSI